MRFLLIPAIVRRPVLRIFAPTYTWLRAVVLLAVIAVVTVGSSARIGGEMNAALQAPGASTIVILLLATPLALAFRSRSLAKEITKP